MAQTNEEWLAELKKKVRGLSLLLDDPQPGLMSWCLMYGRTMEEIVVMWTKLEAKLIAAAPDLLEACQQAAAYFDNCTYIQVAKTGVPFPNLTAAIAKATGETP